MTTEKEMTLAEKRKPIYGKESFICPYCKGYCQQTWQARTPSILVRHASSHDAIRTAKCTLCNQHSIWVSEEMVYPHESSAPEASNHMPEEVKKVFDSARLVSIHSPRAAAVLLRVALEIITLSLDETDPSLNKRIGNLKKKGVDDSVIKSLDIVRIIANEGGAHAGGIDLTGEDGRVVVNKLFLLVNYIVQMTIGVHEEIKQDLISLVPEDKRKWAEDRDKPKSKK